MANVRIGKQIIPRLNQDIYIDGQINKNIWCDSVSLSAGLGGSVATLIVPAMLADDFRNNYRDKKIIVKVGLGTAQKQTIFIGYLTTEVAMLADGADECTFQAASAGYFLSSLYVGDDADRWLVSYKLRNVAKNEFFGHTPTSIIFDLFERLPEEWKTEIALGNISALATNDNYVNSYDFNLLSYTEALETIIQSLANVTIKERFGNDGKTYFDFFIVGEPGAPLNKITFADLSNNMSGVNGFNFSENNTSQEVKNRCQAFGRDRAFIMSCESTVAGIDFGIAEPNTALKKNWDVALEPIVKTNPRLASNDETGLKYKVAEAPSLSNEIKVFTDLQLDLVPAEKAVFTVITTGEQMAVTAFTPGTPKTSSAEATPAVVTVIRQYQQDPAEYPISSLKKDSEVTLKIDGISKVFRSYTLPVSLGAQNECEIISDLPIYSQDGSQWDNQVYLYKSSLAPNEVPEELEEPDPEAEPSNPQNEKTGEIINSRELINGMKIDYKKRTLELQNPALQPIKVYKTPDNKLKREYAETIVGITFCYINKSLPFFYDTGAVGSDYHLPWQVASVKIKKEEFEYNQITNANFPNYVIDVETNVEEEVYYDCILFDPDKKTEIQNPAQVFGVRDDIESLKNTAISIVTETYKRHRGYSVVVGWLDLSYQIGNRVQLLNVKNFYDDGYTINMITHNMPLEGDHNTSIVIDNYRPPQRLAVRLK